MSYGNDGGIQNRHIRELLQKKHHDGYELLHYQPHNVDRDAIYTNLIAKKVLGDAFFSWADARHYRNSFGHAQHCNGHQCSFEHILTKTKPFEDFNTIPVNLHGIAPRSNQLKSFPKGKECSLDNVAFTNLWLVIDNPQNVQLRDLVDTIEFESGGHRYQRYSTSDIELEINILAHIFRVDGVAYHPGKIHVPLVVPYNVFIFNNTYHGARIRVLKRDIDVVSGAKVGEAATKVDVYANVCNAHVLPQLASTTNMTHQCSFVFYRTQFTGPNQISVTQPTIRMFFLHPTYALYIMNVSKEYVTSIRLYVDNCINPSTLPCEVDLSDFDRQLKLYEYPLHDIEWHDNHAIVWFNRQFLTQETLHTNINFSCCTHIHLMMENTYAETHEIEIVAVSFDMMYHGEGMTGLRYVG